MLVLSRKVNQSVVIGNRIFVKVLSIQGDQVKLGIEAPKEIPVHRQEVFDAILRENLEAAQKASIEDLEQLASLFKSTQKNLDTRTRDAKVSGKKGTNSGSS